MRKTLFYWILLLLPFLGWTQDWNFTEKISKEEMNAYDNFGRIVFIKGNEALISDRGMNARGTVHLYEKTENGWIKKQEIIASDGGENDGFGDVGIGFGSSGNPIEMTDNHIVIGAFRKDNESIEDAGAVYVFEKEGDIWVEQYKLVASDSSEKSKYFGKSVSIENNYMVIGSPQAEGGSGNGRKGAAYIYKLVNGVWTEDAKIPIPVEDEGSTYFTPNFGEFVLIKDGYIYVGAKSGGVYIYENINDNWVLVQKLLSSATLNAMGISFAIENDNLIIGHYGERYDENGENMLVNAGMAYYFKKNNEQWELQQKIVASTRTTNACFGSMMDIQGNTLAISAPYAQLGVTQGIFEGSVTLYNLEDGIWVEKLILSPDENSKNAVFGAGLSINGNNLLIGGPLEYFELLPNVGFVYSFELDCSYLVPEVEEFEAICSGESTEITVNAETVNWYASAEAETPLFTAETFTTPELLETTSYWVEINDGTCTSQRLEVVVTVNPLPELVIEEENVQICLGNDATLFAFSEGNVIFWYANEDDEEYLYHGNNFIVENLTETTTYWVEAYNLTTGCASERIPVTVTVNPVPNAPITVEVYIAEEGETLADLEEDIEAEGTLTWYADEFLTIELPNTTPVQDNSVYFVTQTVNGCESEAATIEVEMLGTSDIHNTAFAYYPNPVKDNLYFTGKEKVESVEIFDMSGKLIINQSSIANGIEQLDVTSLPKGTYVVKAVTNKEVKTFKIVKK